MMDGRDGGRGFGCRVAFVFSLVSGVSLQFGSDLGPAEAQPRAERSPTEGSRSDVRKERRPSLRHPHQQGRGELSTPRKGTKTRLDVFSLETSPQF